MNLLWRLLLVDHGPECGFSVLAYLFHLQIVSRMKEAIERALSSFATSCGTAGATDELVAVLRLLGVLIDVSVLYNQKHMPKLDVDDLLLLPLSSLPLLVASGKLDLEKVLFFYITTVSQSKLLKFHISPSQRKSTKHNQLGLEAARALLGVIQTCVFTCLQMETSAVMTSLLCHAIQCLESVLDLEPAEDLVGTVTRQEWKTELLETDTWNDFIFEQGVDCLANSPRSLVRSFPLLLYMTFVVKDASSSKQLFYLGNGLSTKLSRLCTDEEVHHTAPMPEPTAPAQVQSCIKVLTLMQSLFQSAPDSKAICTIRARLLQEVKG